MNWQYFEKVQDIAERSKYICQGGMPLKNLDTGNAKTDVQITANFDTRVRMFIHDIK